MSCNNCPCYLSFGRTIYVERYDKQSKQTRIGKRKIGNMSREHVKRFKQPGVSTKDARAAAAKQWHCGECCADLGTLRHEQSNCRILSEKTRQAMADAFYKQQQNLINQLEEQQQKLLEKAQ